MNEPSPADTATAERGPPATPHDWQPNIVALVCRWCTYAGADLAGTSRLTYPSAVRLVRFPCTGRINPLFILKAYEQGADGVLVSGCHPGDCHYVQGNLYARRRFAVFRELMEFVGLDPRRLHFSWVSASEGAKWVQVVKEVTEAVRSVGPSQPRAATSVAFPRAAATAPAVASEDRLEACATAVRQTAARLLRDGSACAVLGYRRGTLPGRIVPALVTRSEEADSLIWNANCLHNLSVYLPRLCREACGSEGRIAVFVKKCDVGTVIGLLQERQLDRADVRLVGVPCAGMRQAGRLVDKCHACDGRVPPICDIAIADEGGHEGRAPTAPDPRDVAIADLESLPAQARWSYWQQEFARCIRCYACRAACPLCYCDCCIADKHRPQWISPAIDQTGNTAWNIVRAFHLAGRCTGCDECSRACPADIRLDLLNRKLALVVEQRFGYRPGNDIDSSPPLTEFRADDSQEFIR